MFDMRATDLMEPPAPAEVVRALRATVLDIAPAGDPRDGIDQIDELERLKSAICAAQARIAHEIDQHRQAQDQARRALEPRRRRTSPDAGISMELGLARRESPHEGRRKLRLARTLLHDLPETMAALERGDLNERRAEIIATETADLTAAQRRAVDAAIRPDLRGLGDADLRDLVRREVLSRDEEGWLARHARARTKRRVSGRIIGDGMGHLSAVLPATDLSMIMTSLNDAAEAARAGGDERGRGQLLADTLVERLGGLGRTTPAPTALKVVVSAETLLGESTEPGYVHGAGYVPASVSRQLAVAGAQHLGSTVQRLFAMPRTGALIAMESASSFFRGSLAELVDLRDRRCRTPFCNAPIRHRDHVVARSRGGATSADNAQGLCEGCNYAKESPGWRHEPVADPLAVTEVALTTPTGHIHLSRAPAQPIDRDSASPAERLAARMLLGRAA
ncbi:HNH endonuclease [Nocardioides terrigena]|uniref:HNH endonuclease n=1 Tax=Nocardioides terrigena TaxID=424797 RepID=UPI000D314218|nr:HNH endonuclease signature motif containing protein [Nocardioides terrigena]